MTHDENPLPAMVEIYTELQARGLTPLVVGGCAVLIQGKSHRPRDAESLTSRLATATLVTTDVDLALVTTAARLVDAHQAFTLLGYQLEGDDPPRYVRGTGDEREEVDLLCAEVPPRRHSGWIVSQLLPPLSKLPAIEIEGVRSMHPAGLIVLKAVAWNNKPVRKKDLADIAQLAVRDVETGTAKMHLSELVPRLLRIPALRDAIKALRRVRLEFRDANAHGSFEAARALANSELLEIRETLSGAVRLVLEAIE